MEDGLGIFLGPAVLLRRQRERNREFVAAQAGDHRLGPKLGHKCIGNAFQQAIPGLVTVLIVDRLEAVDLQRDDDEVFSPRRRGRA